MVRTKHQPPRCRALLLALLPPLLVAQQVDPRGAEDSRNAGIRISNNGEDVAQFAVLDGRWRWLYTSQSKDCGSAAIRGAAALERCYLQGLTAARYAEAYGVQVGYPNNRAITMNFATKDANTPTPNYGSRLYLTDGKGYTLFAPMAGELSFDVDVSQVPAGMNAAVYLVSMDRFGNLNSVSGDGVMNTAGWRRGLGYCDAQCPKDLRFVQGQGYNKDHVLASCCPEMDLFEGNRFVQAFTAHPCKLAKATVCNSSEVKDCGAACDSAGADINTFRESGPGHALYDMLDVSAPFKINTSFITDNGHPNGTLVDIVQIFSQNGEQKGKLSFADRFKAAKSEGFRPEDEFATVYGGLAQMGEAIRRGMVMVLALWADPSGNMNWLDSCHTNKTIYQCSEHTKFDESVWAQASAVKPGIWRGPADYYPDYETSYKTKDVFFNYDGIPALIRSQVRFGCRGCETASSICDCSGVPYKFTVSNIEAKHRLIPDQPEPTEAPNDNQNSHPNLIWTILLPTVGAVVVAACCAFLCCYACNEDDTTPMQPSRKAAVKAKRSLAPAWKCDESSSESYSE